jgi:hypothetical protein
MMLPRTLFTCCALLLLALAPPARAQEGACEEAYCIYLPALRQPEIVNRSPAPTTSEVHVRNVQVRRPSPTTLNLVGELLNPTAAPVFFVELTARFFNASGHLITEESTNADLPRLGPGARSPFLIYLANPPAALASYTIAVSDGRQSTTLDYRDAEVISVETRDNFGLEVYGQLRNPNSRELRGVTVAVTFYDSAGNVVEVEDGFSTPLNIPVGATASYAMPTFERNLSFARMHVQAQGYLAP